MRVHLGGEVLEGVVPAAAVHDAPGLQPGPPLQLRDHLARGDEAVRAGDSLGRVGDDGLVLHLLGRR